jgi:hypothetical protein
MAGLEPAIQLLFCGTKLDGRVKPAHGELGLNQYRQRTSQFWSGIPSAALISTIRLWALRVSRKTVQMPSRKRATQGVFSGGCDLSLHNSVAR